jgi:CheY-like chemotaxis protein
VISSLEDHPAESATRTILIVDDDRSVADTFARILKLEGFDVATAMSAEAGMEIADSVAPDAIIPSTGCPSPTGGSALIRTKPHLVEVPVIVTGDYFLADAIQNELRSLGASIRFADVPRSSFLTCSNRWFLKKQSDRFLRLLRLELVGRHAGLVHAPGRPLPPQYRRPRKQLAAELCRQPELAVPSRSSRSRSSTSTQPSSSPTSCCPFAPMGLAFDFVKGEDRRSPTRSDRPRTSHA